MTNMNTPTHSEALPLTICSPLRFWLVGWSRLGMQGHHSLTPRGWRYAKSAKAYARMEKARIRYSLENAEVSHGDRGRKPNANQTHNQP